MDGRAEHGRGERLRGSRDDGEVRYRACEEVMKRRSRYDEGETQRLQQQPGALRCVVCLFATEVMGGFDLQKFSDFWVACV